MVSLAALAAPVRMARAAVGSILDWVYPPHCYSCGVPLCGSAHLLCPACEEDLSRSRIMPPLCRTCGLPLVGPLPADTRCTVCAVERRHFSIARAFVRYAGPAAEVVRGFKFRGDFTVGPRLVRDMLGMGWLPAGVGRDIDAVVPVPLAPRRRRERGYDQAFLLAQTVARGLEMELLHGVLIRTRYTAQQALLPARRRCENVRGAFAVVDAALVQDRRMLLVDDVMTTGATANECARTLRKAGAKAVQALTLTRTSP